MIRLGVVGHFGYPDLPEVLRSIRELAPALGLELHYERELQQVAGGASALELPHFQRAFQPMLVGVLIAIVLTLFLKETGARAKKV